MFIADDNQNFDFFSFSQKWSVTSHILLAEKNKHRATSSDQRWMIHGIRPIRIGTISPAFCSKGKSFDVQQLVPFLNELNEHWVNVESGKFI